MDKHAVPHYVAVKSYGKALSENCIPVYKKCIARACCVPVLGVHHQEFGRISLLENQLSTPASLVENIKGDLQPAPVRCTALIG